MPDPSTTPPLSDDARTVDVFGASSGFAQSITIRQHRLLGDESTADGGTDTGPAPYDYLLAALGTCTSITVSGYARRKGWPLESVHVHLRHAKIEAASCVDCDTREGRVDRIEREIELVGALDEDQRTRLLEIANKCPVHRTLTSEISIATTLVGT